MSSNYKNKLQEYCQKNNYPMPSYLHSMEGEPHKLEWKSEVIVNGLSFVSMRPANSKAAADKDVAEIAYMYLVGHTERISQEKKENNVKNHKIELSPCKQTSIIDNEQSIHKKIKDMNITEQNILMVDLENIKIDLKLFSSLKNTAVLLFAAKNTTKYTLIQQIESLPIPVHVMLSSSVGKNAADFYLTFIFGVLCTMYCNKTYYILTNDSFGSYLPAFLNKCIFVCSLYEMRHLMDNQLLEGDY